MISSGAAAVADLKQSYVVEASAGTGKTTALVERIVDVIAANETGIDKIVAVTFTHVAAGNMKLRVARKLEQRRAQELDAAVRGRLATAAQKLDTAFIGTIHSFCAQLLRQRPIEAGVDPNFRELSQPEAIAVFGRVFRTWIESRLASPSDALRRALARLAWREDSERGEPLDSLRNAAWCLAEWRDYDQPWSVREFDREEQIDTLLEEAGKLVALRNRCTNVFDALFTGLQPVADFAERVARAAEVGARDVNTIESDLLRLPFEMRWLKPGYGRFSEAVARETVLTGWAALKARIERFGQEADADLAARLRNELWNMVALYEEAKARAGLLDFMDLLLSARKLLRQNDRARNDLQSKYSHIFVDEFQDTDALQADILLLLAAQDTNAQDWRKSSSTPGKLYLVGDPKQSIYRFRRADAKLYRDICNDLQTRGVSSSFLTTSSRSTEAIQSFVNAAFADMHGYLPLEGGAPAPTEQPSIIALPMPKPYGKRNLSKDAIDDCSPAAVAAFIHWLINESKWKVRNRTTGQWMPIEDKDICILFRRFSKRGSDLTQDYVRCLEARNIKHVLVGSKSFHQREEIGTLRTALRAVEWPDDELSVFAVLRGTLYAIPDDALLRFRTKHGRFSPFLELPAELEPEFHPIREAFDLLTSLHRSRNHRPIADTLNQLLDQTRTHAAFAFRIGGERVLANVYRLADLARSFEITGSATSFRSFIEYLDAEYESTGTSEAPVLEQQADGVQLMTVHKAKGLEFPVVILADLTANLTGAEGGDRYIERSLCAQRLLGCAPWELLENADREREAEEQEALRVAYVAATRARDLLVVSAVGAKQFFDSERYRESWLYPLYDALYPPADRCQIPGKARGCPKFGDFTVLNTPLDLANEVCIRPGLHYPNTGSHEVVWFDPKILALETPKREGVEHEQVLSGTPEQAETGLERYREWEARRQSVIRTGSAPAFDLRLAHQLRHLDEAEHIEIRYEQVQTEAARPSNRKFGVLVHEILQHAESLEDCRHLAEIYGRKHGIPRPDLDAAAQTAVRAFAHVAEILQSAIEVHREFPIVVRLADGSVVEGNVDLACFDGEAWTVLDYKTGRAGDPIPAQLQLYALALERSTGFKAQGVFLEI
jgi:ATP-dependent exoDNAse (exonuclease V) beta subunit